MAKVSGGAAGFAVDVGAAAEAAPATAGVTGRATSPAAATAAAARLRPRRIQVVSARRDVLFERINWFIWSTFPERGGRGDPPRPPRRPGRGRYHGQNPWL